MRIAVCAKSPWIPRVRREHALARTGAAAGADVVFVESPRDIRSPGRPRVPDPATTTGVTVVPRFAPLPGHRGMLPAAVDAALLRHRLIMLHRQAPLDAVVVQLPWHWAAVRHLPLRRVFDAADDWSALIPQRAGRIRRWYREVATDADLVVVAAPGLAALFPAAPVQVVPNGVDAHLSAGAPRPAPGRRRLAYLGTLSERFDTAFVDGLLAELPREWCLDLHGDCQYAGSGDAPGPELDALLAAHPGRVRWHGPVGRDRVPAVLDAADVLLVPNRPQRSGGQSSMKMLDYAARGRPVVSTHWDEGLRERSAPGTALVTTPAEAARAVVGAGDEDPALPARRVAWARERSWEVRWEAWSAAVLGRVAVEA